MFRDLCRETGEALADLTGWKLYDDDMRAIRDGSPSLTALTAKDSPHLTADGIGAVLAGGGTPFECLVALDLTGCAQGTGTRDRGGFNST